MCKVLMMTINLDDKITDYVIVRQYEELVPSFCARLTVTHCAIGCGWLGI